ncbi:IS630 transposase-related protein [Wolbachia endosymbiont (group A) of Nomada goodeniana]|uniref:IS630 transposase-related protein n=1 Tax=Wolbachia endosymbiont (group A) of Nomada goodeniana TaxID=3066207 RepID=UPI003340D358
MPAAYSYDLRKKAMEALDEGESRETVAARFKIGRTTLWEWQQRNRRLSIKKTWKWGLQSQNYRLGYLCQICQRTRRKDSIGNG